MYPSRKNKILSSVNQTLVFNLLIITRKTSKMYNIFNSSEFVEKKTRNEIISLNSLDILYIIFLLQEKNSYICISSIFFSLNLFSCIIWTTYFLYCIYEYTTYIYTQKKFANFFIQLKNIVSDRCNIIRYIFFWGLARNAIEPKISQL